MSLWTLPFPRTHLQIWPGEFSLRTYFSVLVIMYSIPGCLSAASPGLGQFCPNETCSLASKHSKAKALEGHSSKGRPGGGRVRVSSPPRSLVWRYWEFRRVCCLLGASTGLKGTEASPDSDCNCSPRWQESSKCGQAAQDTSTFRQNGLGFPIDSDRCSIERCCTIDFR